MRVSLGEAIELAQSVFIEAITVEISINLHLRGVSFTMCDYYLCPTPLYVITSPTDTV